MIETCDLILSLLAATGESIPSSATQLTSSGVDDSSILVRSLKASTASVPSSSGQNNSSNVSPTSQVVMQWKSHACLELLKKEEQKFADIMQSHKRRGDIGTEDEGRKMNAQKFAEDGILLTLDCALDSHSTRNVLLAFHAIMVRVYSL